MAPAAVPVLGETLAACQAQPLPSISVTSPDPPACGATSVNRQTGTCLRHTAGAWKPAVLWDSPGSSPAPQLRLRTSTAAGGEEGFDPWSGN